MAGQDDIVKIPVEKMGVPVWHFHVKKKYLIDPRRLVVEVGEGDVMGDEKPTVKLKSAAVYDGLDYGNGYMLELTLTSSDGHIIRASTEFNKANTAAEIVKKLRSFANMVENDLCQDA